MSICLCAGWREDDRPSGRRRRSTEVARPRSGVYVGTVVGVFDSDGGRLDRVTLMVAGCDVDSAVVRNAIGCVSSVIAIVG